MEYKLIHGGDGTLIDVAMESQDAIKHALDDCARLRDTGQTGHREMRHLAQIPAWVVHRWLHDHGIAFKEFMRDTTISSRMLNDPALAGFRIAQGTV
jgi:hypothetical protein